MNQSTPPTELPSLAVIASQFAAIERGLPRRDVAELYKPLDHSRIEIRTLRLFAFGQPDGMIHCILNTKSLLDEPRYNAISYAWGDPTETVELVCNNAVVRVTKGLHSALANLRRKLTSPDMMLELWIDGLCINQADLDERRHQVLIMDKIYQNAIHTIVWIGPEADDSDSVIDTLTRMGQSESLDGSKPETWIEFPELWDHTFWVSLHRLFRRSYWTRLWVLQEVAVSRSVSVCCGMDEIKWPDLVAARSCLSNMFWNEPWKHLPPEIVWSLTNNASSILVIFNNTRANFQYNFGQPILSQMLLSCQSRCSDPRDKIYALLGISSDDDFVTIPDYRASVRDVYTDFLSRKLAEGASSDVLLFSGSGIFLPEDRTCDLPSWVCDWVAWSTLNEHMGAKYAQLYRTKSKSYSAAGVSNSTINTKPGSDVLTTKSVFCNKVISAQKNVLQDTKFWAEFARGKQENYPTGIPPLQAAFRTLSLDYDFRGQKRLGEKPELLANLVAGFVLHLYMSLTEKDDSEIIELLEQPVKASVAFQLWKTTYAGHSNDNPDETMKRMFLGEDWQDLDLEFVQKRSSRACYELFQQVSRMAKFCSFFRTEDGYYGLGPLFTEPGDEIFVLLGLNVPFVMRRHATHYEMVGPCFVLGFMDGEAMDFLDSGMRSLQDLALR